MRTPSGCSGRAETQDHWVLASLDQESGLQFADPEIPFFFFNSPEVDQGLMLSRLKLIDVPTLLIYNGKCTWFKLLSWSVVQNALSSTNPHIPSPFTRQCPVCTLRLLVGILALRLFHTYKVASFDLAHQRAACCPSPGAVHVIDALPIPTVVSRLHLLPLFSRVGSSLQALPAFPMKDLLRSEGVMAREDSVWRSGGKSLLFPGKTENSISLLSLQSVRGTLTYTSPVITYCSYVKSLGEWKSL